MAIRREYFIKRYTFETSKTTGIADGLVEVEFGVHVMDVVHPSKVGPILQSGDVTVSYAVYNGNHFVHNFRVIASTVVGLALDERHRMTQSIRNMIVQGSTPHIIFN